MKKYLSIIALLGICIQFSCESETPDLLKQLSKRENELNGGGSGGGGNNSTYKYNGIHAEKVQMLLSRITGWNETTAPPCINMIRPGCQRDSYVCAAISYAWAAEMHARQGDFNTATYEAREMMNNLSMADQLCGGSPPPSGGVCGTWSIYPC